MTLAERIQALIDYSGLSIPKFSVLVGFKTPQAVREILKGNTKTLSDAAKMKLQSAFPHLNERWLLLGEGEMLKDVSDDALYLGKAKKAINEEAVEVKFFDVTPTATFQEFEESIAQNYDTMRILPQNRERIDDSYCVFEIHGDSMQPTVLSHSRILCKEIPESQWHYAEGVVVIAYGSKVVLKRIKRNELLTNNILNLASDNKDYGTETIQLSDIHCIFKAKRIISQDIF